MTTTNRPAPPLSALDLYLILQRELGGWHPDDDPSDLLSTGGGRPLFTTNAADAIVKLTNAAFADAHTQGVDLYAALLDIANDQTS